MNASGEQSSFHPFVVREDMQGAALRAALREAERRGCSHLVVLGSVGEHDRSAAALCEAAAGHPDALVIGDRTDEAMTRSDRLASALVRLECGLRFSDARCSMRVYPLRLLRWLPDRALSRGIETELLVRAVWAGCPVVRIWASDATPRDMSSRDWLHFVALHAKLLARAMSPWPHQTYDPRSTRPAQLISPGSAGASPSNSSASVKYIPYRSAAIRPGRTSVWTKLKQWFSPIGVWRELREGKAGRTELATALAVGVFIGNLPAYGLQTLLSLYTARQLRLQPLAVLTGSHISTPPIGPALIAAAVCVGHVLLHGSLPSWPAFAAARGGTVAKLLPYLLDWAVGGVILGAVLAIIAFLLADVLFRCVCGTASHKAAIRVMPWPTNLDRPL